MLPGFIPVNRLIISLGGDHLGRQVVWCSAQRPRNVGHFLGEPEIGNLQMTMAVQQQILRFEITVDNLMSVQILQGQRDFGGIKLGHGIGEPL